MKKSARLVFFGTDQFSRISLQALLEAGWEFVAIVAKPDSRAGRGRKLTPPAVKAAAEKYNIPLFQPKKPTDIGHDLAALAPTHGVVVSYGAILPESIIDIFPAGIINLHPSLLPSYRGPSPVEATIIGGDSHTGVSLMQLSSKMDAGPVYAQKAVAIGPSETEKSLSDKLAAIGAHFLIEKLPLIVSGFLHGHEQDEAKATYTKLLSKEDGRIKRSLPAEVIERQIRAYLRYPKSRIRLEGHDVIVTKARVARGENDGHLIIKCQPGWLEIQRLIGPSGKTMSGADFLRGYQKK